MNCRSIKEFVRLTVYTNMRYITHTVHVSKIKFFHGEPFHVKTNTTIIIFKNQMGIKGEGSVLGIETRDSLTQFKRRYVYAKNKWLNNYSLPSLIPNEITIMGYENLELATETSELVKDEVRDFYYQRYLKSKKTIG